MPKLIKNRIGNEVMEQKKPDIEWIMISGPYSSNGADAKQRRKNLEVLNRIALEVYNRGYFPVIGVNCALPLIQVDGKRDSFDKIMMPLSLAMSERCDACLRVGGPSAGADKEVERFRAKGKPVFFSLDDLTEK